jgi:hypothetical protein
MNQSLAYILAASIKELFPAAQIDQIVATPKCFFCDVAFPGEFRAALLPTLEERMREWVRKKLPFKVLTMMPSNATQMLEHHGDKKLAQKIKHEVGEISLLQLDRFFFQIEGEAPTSTGEASHFKLACFWPLKKGIRLLGASGLSKESLKEQVQILKTVQNPQNVLEEQKYISWIGESLIWEPRAEQVKAQIKKKILEIYAGFDEVALPDLDEREQKKLLLEWIRFRKRGGVRFQKKRSTSPVKAAWDVAIAPADQGWGQGPTTSYLHLITKFLTMLSFEYEIVSVGTIGADLEKVLHGLHLTWTPYRGKEPRLEFQVVDQLGCRWTLSTLEWDRKGELVQVTLCVSLERCVALLADSKTLLNR